MFAVGIPTLAVLAGIVAFASLSFSGLLEQNAKETAALVAMERGAIAKNFLSGGMQIAKDLAGIAGGMQSIPVDFRREYLSAVTKATLESNGSLLASWYIFEPNALDGRDAEFEGMDGHTLDGRFVPYWYREGSEVLLDYATLDEQGTVGPFYDVPYTEGREYLSDPYEFDMDSGEIVRALSFCVPVFVNGKKIGVAGVDYMLADLAVLADSSRTKDRYAFILAGDASIVSFPDTAYIGKSFSDAFPQADTSFGVSAAIAANTCSSFLFDSPLDGAESLVVVEPVRLSPRDSPWAFGIVYAHDQVLAPARRVTFLMIGAGFIAAGLVALALVLSLNVVVVPLKKLDAALQDVAQGDGDLTRRLAEKSGDELGRIGHGFNTFAESLIATVRVVQDTARQLTGDGRDLADGMASTMAASQSIRQAVADIHALVDEQAASATETSATLDEVSGGVSRLAASIEAQASGVTESSASVEETLSSIASVGRSVDRMASDMEQLSRASEDGHEKLAAAGRSAATVLEQSKSLAQINAVIAQVAARTNLLAMNAAIEAAHAGASGAGFAVVADEIRNLAEQSGKQAGATGRELKAIVASIAELAEATNEAEQSFKQVKERMDGINGLSAEIKDAMNEQNAGSRQVLTALSEINKETTVVRSSSDEMRSAIAMVLEEMRRLEKYAQGIKEIVETSDEQAQEIAQASGRAADMAKRTQERIQALSEAAARFKTS
ncbi:MAG TPA: methyl-accepting chemotaxis protein [Spirochaetales bacterium]|nr:methyl-accepting chemotaxis protein [Spirochaetales bacterium]